jgi:uncharacterized MAPEG superfamily protein
MAASTARRCVARSDNCSEERGDVLCVVFEHVTKGDPAPTAINVRASFWKVVRLCF